ncbi:hypothetical protein BN12_100019 [Nostocoides japonicum T1-X7]|uniref:Uncharacterized protein n=1 Tax=Nostocoides japonicum T1-X7 TaxID=1194083 RepID=A0A077LVJ5_9MICO|nr:hypothetical protein BN12_100019 [Tetrasphaera japonica T1-X7]
MGKAARFACLGRNETRASGD